MRPIQVYLDNSAFSNLAIGGRNTDLLPSFIHLRESGHVEFRFSIVHILEAVATEKQYLSASKNRLEVISQLCGTCCLVDPYKIWRLEALALPSRSQIYRNDGWWLPFERDIQIDLPDPRQIVKQELASLGLNRKARRQTEATVFTKAGTLTPYAVQMAVAGAEKFAIDLGENYPLSLEVRKMAVNALVGKIPRAVFDRRLKDSFAQLSQFQLWHEMKWDEMAPCISWLRKQGSAYADLLREMRTRIESLREQGLRNGLSEEQLQRMNEKHSKMAEARILERVVERVRSEVGEATTYLGTWEQSPGLRSNLSLACFSFMGTVLPARNARGAKDSDFGDILHATYLPFVDVFHADAYAASHLRNVGSKLGTRVKARLEEVLSEIEKLKATIDRGEIGVCRV